MRAFRKINVKDRELSFVQDAVGAAFVSIQNNPLLNVVLLEGVVLTSGSVNQIDHGLGRNYRFWIPANLNANAVVYESTSDNPDLYLKLNTTANCTVSLIVG